MGYAYDQEHSANNSNGRLSTIKVGTSSGASDRLYFLYGYDSFGNIGGMTEQYNGGASSTYIFGYDAQNRLTRGYAPYNASLTCATNSSGGWQTEQGYRAYGPGACWARRGGSLATDQCFTAPRALPKFDSTSLYYYDACPRLNPRLIAHVSHSPPDPQRQSGCSGLRLLAGLALPGRKAR